MQLQRTAEYVWNGGRKYKIMKRYKFLKQAFSISPHPTPPQLSVASKMCCCARNVIIPNPTPPHPTPVVPSIKDVLMCKERHHPQPHPTPPPCLIRKRMTAWRSSRRSHQKHAQKPFVLEKSETPHHRSFRCIVDPCSKCLHPTRSTSTKRRKRGYNGSPVHLRTHEILGCRWWPGMTWRPAISSNRYFCIGWQQSLSKGFAFYYLPDPFSIAWQSTDIVFFRICKHIIS